MRKFAKRLICSEDTCEYYLGTWLEVLETQCGLNNLNLVFPLEHLTRQLIKRLLAVAHH